MTAASHGPIADPRPADEDGPDSSQTVSPAAAIAALCLVGAGLIHVAASQTHLEEMTLSRIFLVMGVAQLLFGGWVLLRPSYSSVLGATVLLSGAAVVGWAQTRMVDIPWIAGLEQAEAPQAADTIAAGLAAVAAVQLGLTLRRRNWSVSSDRWVAPMAVSPIVPALGTVAVVLVISLIGVDRLAAHEHSGSGEHDHGDAPATAELDQVGVDADHADHGDDAEHGDHAATDAGEDHSGHGEGEDEGGAAGGEHADHGDATTDTGEPWRLDATDPETADIRDLVSVTQAAVERYPSIAAATEEGYVKINSSHLLRVDLVFDDKILDPDAIESLTIAQTEDGEDYITGAMYLMKFGQEMREVPRIGGPLTVWHSHGGFCFELDGKIAELDEETGECPAGSAWLDDPPMLHIYSEPMDDGSGPRSAAACGTFTFMDLPFDQTVPGCEPTGDEGVGEVAGPAS